MKKNFIALMIGVAVAQYTVAQTNTFPASGNVGIGILTPATTLQVIGTSRFGSAGNYAQVNNNGILSFTGSGSYYVGQNKYAFQFGPNPAYGLFFNSTLSQYEFKDGNARPIFSVHADLGDGTFFGGVKLGNSASLVAGNMRWSGSDFEGYNGSGWQSLTGKNSWSLTGNAGTNPANNFIGTTDFQPLIFKVNNNKAGLLDPSSSTVSFGVDALGANTTGVGGTAIGDGALRLNTSGQINTAVGAASLASNTTGSNNTALGYISLYANTTGSNNTALGRNALYENTQGSANIAIGVFALRYNTKNSNLVAIGDSALYNNGTGAINIIDGSRNVAVGSKALYGNGSGTGNTAIGYLTCRTGTASNFNTAVGDQALTVNTANSNTAIGSYSMLANVTGDGNSAVGSHSLGANVSGINNVAVGNEALNNNISGSVNTAVGRNALYSSTASAGTAIGGLALYNNTSGGSNTAVGYSALYGTTTGGSNTAVGYLALGNNVTGSNLTALGFDAGVSAANNNLTNATAIGYAARVDASNKVRVGNTSVTSIGGQVGWTNFSDERVKKDIKENVPGLKFIKALRAVTYHYDVAKENEMLGAKEANTATGKADLEKIAFTGFLAQEVDAAAKKIGYDFSGVDKTGDIMGIRYAEFVVPLVKAVQELSKLNDDKDEAIKTQGQQIADLQQQMNELKQLLKSKQQATGTSMQNVTLTGTESAQLGQNTPNPFNNTTAINYVLPAAYSVAKIIVTDKNGRTVKEINISGTGKGRITLDASALAGGTYQYTMYVNNKAIDSKQMILVK